MAYKKRVEIGTLKAELEGADFFWNIKNHVGYGYPNNRMDVMLVQFLLNCAIRYWNELLNEDASLDGEPYKLLVPDGKFGGKTWGAIKWFQRETKDSESMADGMVSPGNGMILNSPKTNQIYTIYTLNKVYRVTKPAFWNKPWEDLECPELLKMHFRTTVSIPGSGISSVQPYSVSFRGGIFVGMGDGSVRF